MNNYRLSRKDLMPSLNEGAGKNFEIYLYESRKKKEALLH
jgi:hypothetical protein